MIKLVNQFVGRPHRADGYDCADLAIDVAREIFSREVALPAARPRPRGQRGQAVAIQAMADELALRLLNPSMAIWC